MWTVVLAIAIVTPGCLGGDDGADDDGAGPGGDGDGSGDVPGTPMVYPNVLTGCQATIVEVGVPASAVQPHLPEGFRVLSMAEVVGAGADSQDGNLGVEMFVCESIDGLAGPVANAVYGSFFSAVEPPEELREDVTFHFVKWDTVVADQMLRDVLSAAGAPVWPGTASYDTFMALGPAIQTAGSITFGNWTQTFEGAGVTPAPDLMTGTFVEFTPTANGFVTWRATWTFDQLAIGPVSVTATEGSIAYDIMGPGPAQGAAFVGVINFDGNITVPA